MSAIYKREFLSYFRSPIGYVALAVFTFMSSYLFSLRLVSLGESNIASEILAMRNYLIIIVPIITMALFSEDKKRGTEVIYYTSPVSLFSVVIGKFLAAMTLFAIMFCNVFVHMIITKSLGGVINTGTWGAVVVYFFFAALFISIGIFASAITDSQLISAIVCFVILYVINMIPNIAAMITTGVQSLVSLFSKDAESIKKVCDAVNNGILWLDPFSKTSDFVYGIFSVAPLIFCLSGAVVFIYLTYRVLEKKRWSQA